MEVARDTYTTTMKIYGNNGRKHSQLRANPAPPIKLLAYVALRLADSYSKHVAKAQSKHGALA